MSENKNNFNKTDHKPVGIKASQLIKKKKKKSTKDGFYIQLYSRKKAEKTINRPMVNFKKDDDYPLFEVRIKKLNITNLLKTYGYPSYSAKDQEELEQTKIHETPQVSTESDLAVSEPMLTSTPETYTGPSYSEIKEMMEEMVFVQDEEQYDPRQKLSKDVIVLGLPDEDSTAEDKKRLLK